MCGLARAHMAVDCSSDYLALSPAANRITACSVVPSEAQALQARHPKSVTAVTLDVTKVQAGRPAGLAGKSANPRPLVFVFAIRNFRVWSNSSVSTMW